MDFKNTEIGLIPKDWEIKKLSEIGETLIGLTYSPSNVRSNGTLVLRSSNIQNGKLAFENNVYVQMPLPDRVIVQENDILICVRNGSRQLIGKCALIDYKTAGSAFGAFMSVYRSHYGRYAFYQFQSNAIQKQINETLGATINQITNKDLSRFQIAIPPTKAEQIAIAGALNDADALITSLERLIAKKKAIRQGAMQELFRPDSAWQWISLKQIGKPYGGLSGKGKSDFTKGNSPYIPFVNVIRNTIIDPSDIDYVKVSPTEKQNKVTKGDLLFNGSSETPEELGMSSVLLNTVPDLFLNSFCFGFRLFNNEETNALYLAYFFRSNYGRRLIYILSQGATRYNLSKSNFVQLNLQIPTFEEQVTIAAILKNMDAEIDLLDQKLEKQKRIKQGTMQVLLTGKIRLI